MRKMKTPEMELVELEKIDVITTSAEEGTTIPETPTEKYETELDF